MSLLVTGTVGIDTVVTPQGRADDVLGGSATYFSFAASLFARVRLVAFHRYPKEHWLHLRTTNVVESPFAAVRLRTAAAKRYKKVPNATAVIWKTLLLAERRFRKLNAAHLLKEVWQGTRFADGVRVSKRKNRKSAA